MNQGWLLSTVLVGSVAFGYAQYADHRSEKQERRKQAQKIVLEVAFRTRIYEQVKQREKDEEVPWARSARKALDGIDVPDRIYPEFIGRSLVSLLWELTHLCNNPQIKKSLTQHRRVFSRKLATGAKQLDENLLEQQIVALKKTVDGLLLDAE